MNAVYLCFEVYPSNLSKALSAALSLNFKGLNVTIPHKEKIIKYLDRTDRTAKIIGAVNTVKIEKTKLWGFNTDMEGFGLSLKKYKFCPKGKNILILGSGGAAKALSAYLASKEIESIFFYDILHKKAISLAKRIKDYFSQVKNVAAYQDKKDIDLKNIDLLINATGVGLNKADPVVIDLNNFQKNLVVYDLIYNPLQSSLLREAEKKGLSVINGLWMLIYQALCSESIWWGRDFSSAADDIYRILIKELK